MAAQSKWTAISFLLIGSGIVIILVAIILGILWFGGVIKSPGAQGNVVQVNEPRAGSPAPDFELKQLSGETLRLEDLRGNPILINFWATWCPPCREEMPLIQQYFDINEPELVVLAVNLDESKPTVSKFVSDMGLTFPVLLDIGGKVSDLYRVRGYPTSVFVDREGIIQAVHIGSFTEGALVGYLGQIGIEH
jgi:peroxiredoxin